MRRKLNALFTIVLALMFFVSVSPIYAASSDKKEKTKTSATKKKRSSSKDKKSSKATTSATKKKASSSKDKKSSKATTSPTKKKASSSKDKKSSKATTSPFKGTVNINSASKEQLMQLPGIGEVKAAEIIKTRKKSGKFKKADDLLKVDGIGEKTLKGFKKNLKF